MYYYYNKRFLHDSLEIIPDRAIPLTDKEHSELFAAFARGYELSEDENGRPVAVPPQLTLDKVKASKKTQIDVETSAAILAGFDYAVNGVTYHFSYDAFDQQNFADTANVCIMKQAGMPGLPDSVMWNAYTVPDDELVRLTFDAPGFLAFYAGGAMKHKNGTIQRGGERKAAVEAATPPEEVEAA